MKWAQEFREERSRLMKKKWSDPSYHQKQAGAMKGKTAWNRNIYTCQLCHNKGGKLQVDHIQSWAEYVELRFDINNCRTLCMACHYKVTFGRELPEGVTDWGHNLSQIRG